MSPSLASELHAHAHALRRLASHLVGEHDADDVLQDAAVQALTAPPAQPGPLGGWMTSVVRGIAAKHHRNRQRRRRREEIAARAERLPAADAELLARDTFRDLAEAVLALPQPYQSVLLRRYLQEQSPRAIATATGLPVATVKSQLQRGLAMVRARLAGRDGRDWRLGLGALFGCEGSTLVGTTGVFLMTSGVKFFVAAAAAAVFVAAFFWFDRPSAAPPAAAPSLPPASELAAAAETTVTGHEDAPDPRSESPVRVEVPATATWIVRGQAVQNSNRPAPSARIVARAYRATEAKGEPAVETLLVADADGRFDWPLEPPEVVTFCELRGEGERVHSYPETFVVAPGDPPPRVRLSLSFLDARVLGRVLDDRGQPIVGARVRYGWRSRGVPTGEGGRFELAVPTSPTVGLTVGAHGFVDLRHDVAIDVQRGVGEVDLSLRRANRIHGRITDDDGRPVAGATVRTFYTIYADGAETDDDGRYVLDNLDPSLASHSVFARREGFVEAKAEVQASAADVAQDLVMHRGTAVTGTVFGPSGQPIPAATVFLGSSPNAYDRLDAFTDLHGRFAFPCVAAGEHTLNVERRGLASKRQEVTVPAAPAPALDIRVVLDAGHFVAGRVRDREGQPMANVSIAPRLGGEYLSDVRGTTDAAGRFRLEGLPADGLSLELYGRGVLRKQVPITDADRDDLDIVLDRHGFMAGTVVDGRSGEPLRTFRIRFGDPRLQDGEQQGGGYSASWVRGGKVFRADDGTFRIDEEVQIGAVFALEASADGFAPTVDDHVVVQADADPAQVVFRLFPGTSVAGTVRDRETSLPIAGARIKAYVRGRPLQPHEPNDDEGRPIATSDAQGAFQLENVPEGDVFLRVEHADWLPATHGPITVTRATITPAQQVVLGHGATVTVAVRDAAGAPLAGVEVLIGSEQRTARADASGTAIIERVPPGTHEVALVERRGDRACRTFSRQIEVEHDDCQTEFVASDGDATLVVHVEGEETLPEDLVLSILPAHPETASGFRRRSAFAQPGRNVIDRLPALDLRVMLFVRGFVGNAPVTTRAGQTVEVHLPVSKMKLPLGR
ncbi:MAG: sigma-70 family RNA polymerase sigma factor [Planctomycetota bacterium]